MSGEFGAGLFGLGGGGPEPRPFTQWPWVRFLLRLSIWGSVLVAILVGSFLNSVLLKAPVVYDDIHRFDNWTPFASLTPEAQAFAFELWYRPTRPLGLFVPNCWEFYDIREDLLLRLTSSPEVIQEIVVSKVTIPAPPQRQVSLEDLMGRCYGDRDRLEWCLKDMLRKGKLSPLRYRALRHWLQTQPEERPTGKSGWSGREI